MGVRQLSKHELAQVWRPRYLKAGKAKKGSCVMSLCEPPGYHQKYAVGLPRDRPLPPRKGHGGRPHVYSSVVAGALRVISEASDCLCGKRLAPFFAELVPALETAGSWSWGRAIRDHLLTLSAATIDRCLRPFRLQARPHELSTVRPGTLLKQQVPVRTYTPWEEERPGFAEIDLVAHCRMSTAGHYLNTLTIPRWT